MNLLSAMFNTGSQQTALDRFQIPDNHVAGFYERRGKIDECEDHEESTQEWLFWEWVYSQWPILKGCLLRINFENVLRPTLDTLDRIKYPRVGRKFSQVCRVPSEHIYPVLELCGHEDCGGTIQKYELWKYIHDHFCSSVIEGDWMIRNIAGDSIWICALVEDEDEEDEE